MRFIILLILIFFVTPAQSGVIEYSNTRIQSAIDYMIGWSVPKYNLGHTLKKIEFTLTADISGYSRGENLSNIPILINLRNEGEFAQIDQFGNTLFDFTVFREDSFNAGPWDGSFPPDWDGASGKEFVQSSLISITKTIDFTDPLVLAQYTGIGSVSIPASAKGISSTSFTGSNLVVSQYETQKGLQSLVRYYYAPIPEPKTYGLIAIGVCFALILYHRKK